ncbi:MAG: HD-GYP domain-containing protein [Methylotenera sp.]|nr:HD-GYP domain-containing protein [Methylotenera sp.]MDO9388042.1 HD-GYP domain-containing protein [Methylotenera sp.]
MSDIRRKKTQVSELDVGMYVCELDRPWLETPFMLEGLLLEDNEQIDIIESLCEFVYVDNTVSVGIHYKTAPNESVAIKHDGAINHINVNATFNQKSKGDTTKKNNITASNPKFSFLDILKEIKASNQSSLATSANNTGDNIMFNVQYISNSIDSASLPSIKTDDNPTLVSQIKADFSNLFSGLTRFGSKHKKLKSTIDKVALKVSSTKNVGVDNGDAITIFDESKPIEDEIAKIYPVYEKSQIATREMFEALALDQKIDLTNIHAALDGMVESIERNPDALIWLAKLKQTDDYTYNHALNVSITLMALASFMSLSKKQVKDLGLAGLLQDIGKGKIPSELLHKQEEITAEEFEILKKHVDFALELLEITEDISSTVILTVSQHHERIDGSGYPHHLTGKQISLAGQMAGLVDSYCALTTSKVYAEAVYNQIALEELYTLRGVKFNSALIDQLVQFLGMYPVSSLVELNSGEIGVVIQQNTVRRLLPRVMILLNPDKTKNEYPAVINLINAPPTPSGDPYIIVRGLPPNSYGLSPSNYYG